MPGLTPAQGSSITHITAALNPGPQSCHLAMAHSDLPIAAPGSCSHHQASSLGPAPTLPCLPGHQPTGTGHLDTGKGGSQRGGNLPKVTQKAAASLESGPSTLQGHLQALWVHGHQPAGPSFPPLLEHPSLPGKGRGRGVGVGPGSPAPEWAGPGGSCRHPGFLATVSVPPPLPLISTSGNNNNHTVVSAALCTFQKPSFSAPSWESHWNWRGR